MAKLVFIAINENAVYNLNRNELHFKLNKIFEHKFVSLRGHPVRSPSWIVLLVGSFINEKLDNF